MSLTLAQYKDRVAKKGVPATGDASTQLTYCINFARREVWYSYAWPFKRVISSSFNITSASTTAAIATIDSTLRTITRVVDTTNKQEIIKDEFDNILDRDIALTIPGDSLQNWCWYDGANIMFWPTLNSGVTIAATAYGEKILTDLAADTDTDTDITDLDISEVVIMLAHARALVENDEIIKKSSEYKDAMKFLNKLIMNNYGKKTKGIKVPGWNIITGNVRK